MKDTADKTDTDLCSPLNAASPLQLCALISLLSTNLDQKRNATERVIETDQSNKPRARTNGFSGSVYFRVA